MTIKPMDDKEVQQAMLNHLKSLSPDELINLAQNAGTDCEQVLAAKLREYVDYAKQLEVDFATAQREIYALRNTPLRRIKNGFGDLLGRIELWWRQSMHKRGPHDGSDARQQRDFRRDHE